MKPTSLSQGEMKEALSHLTPTHNFRYVLPGGGAVDFTSLGGMPVGWFLDSKDMNAQNVFWNPMKGFGKVLRKAYEADKAGRQGPWNIGGLTFWAGPEIGSDECANKTRFCEKPGDYSYWVNQLGMGLGGYSMVPKADSIMFHKTADLREYQVLTEDKFTFARHFHLAQPSREAGKGIKHASALEFSDRLSSTTAKDFQVWDLLRLPAGTGKDAGTVVFAASKPGMSVYMAQGNGKKFDDYVHFGDDHTSVRISYSAGSLHKLALPPSCMRLVDRNSVIMYVTPLPSGNHQLLVAKFEKIPRKKEDILEVPCLSDEDKEKLSDKMSHDRGGLFNYLGPSPTNPDDYFTELEGVGTRPIGPTADIGYRSDLRGRMEAYEGDLPALTKLVQEFGAISKPYLFE